MMQHVFIIGSKGIPARYGGFETFVEKLTKYNNGNFQYHVACLSTESGSYVYNDAICTKIKTPDIGPAKAVYYDCAALRYYIRYCRTHSEISRPVFYVLACRIGPFIGYYKKQIHALGGQLYVNPDGQEWKRRKWCRPIRWYWKLSEKGMVKQADRIICDSKAIEKYIQKEYQDFEPRTCFIPYGADKTELSSGEIIDAWLKKWHTKSGDYYLLVGRFVPENNFETIIREFIASSTQRKLMIITGTNSKLKKQICHATGCDKDSRIVFAGTEYDQGLLCKIRENAYASFHGHEVGGTNPSLLEGLLCTRVNLVLDVVYNREVAEDGALYWNKEPGNLKKLIERVETMLESDFEQVKSRAALRLETVYHWSKINQSYQQLFLENKM